MPTWNDVDAAKDRAVSRLRAIGPGWWSAVAAAAGAGAVLVPSHRWQAGLFVGGVVLAVALWQEAESEAAAASSCDECAGAGDHLVEEKPATGGAVNAPAGIPWE